jgi:hypothetical protein
MRRARIGIIGSGSCTREAYALAEEVGKRVAEQGGILVSGGLGGVMEAASKGAKEAGGLTIGILPGDDAEAANPYVDIPIVTGMSFARNVIVVRTSQAIIAIEGGYGTLSEIAFALQLGVPLVGLQTTFHDERMIKADSPADAVEKAFKVIKG